MTNGAKEKAPRPGMGNEASSDITGEKYTPRLNQFLPLDLSDFEVKDNALSEVEHLVFLRLVKHYWLTAAPLPASDVKLARIARVSATEWRRHSEAVLAFFAETPHGWEPVIYREALDRAQETVEKRRQAGRIGGLVSGQRRRANASVPPSTCSKQMLAKNEAPSQADTGTDRNYQVVRDTTRASIAPGGGEKTKQMLRGGKP
ncbi:MAG: YdaU family protein [Chromatiaceae bacterium]|jgi:uncharacterized protein YdaU (DUF1376 family)|nr:YdaU family protein [Chromatiaceae bacterium]